MEKGDRKRKVGWGVKTEGRTPCEEDVWERDELEHRAVVVLQVNVGLSHRRWNRRRSDIAIAGTARCIRRVCTRRGRGDLRKEAIQEEERRNRGPATQLYSSTGQAAYTARQKRKKVVAAAAAVVVSTGR